MKLVFPFLCLVLGLCCLHAATDMADPRLMPDTIVLKNGKELHGLIIKNEAFDVILQQRMGEVEILKSNIRRIEDQGESHVYFAEMITPGRLPPWRMVVQDLRTDDNIHSFIQIPPSTIQSGYLRNIPYLSFRVNERVEMNVYGNPEDPVCLEFGIYEHGEKITRFKKIIRAYLGGCLSSRSEIGALYGLSEKGDEKMAGKLCFKVLPPTAPDAFGGWWISVFDPIRLAKARVNDAAYKKVTLPFSAVNKMYGRLREGKSAEETKFLSSQMQNWEGVVPGLCGFYRDKDGQLKFLPCLPKIHHSPSVISNP